MDKKIEQTLKGFRDRIDRIDQQILDLINRRLALAKSIGEAKSQLDNPAYYRPEREAQVLARLHGLNHGLLKPEALEILFREIMSTTRGIEAGLSVAVLGPAGTYTEAAARRHFGSALAIKDFARIDEIFRAVEKQECDFAVVPIENSTEGGINSTLSQLVSTPLVICSEINLSIYHNLLSRNSGCEEITRVYAHSLSFGQCQNWLNYHLPNADLIPVSSNAEAARRAAEEDNTAAIAAEHAAKIYYLDVLFSAIEDESGNTTRFLVLSDSFPPPSGNDKTSLLLSCQSRPGALTHLLEPLHKEGINMTKIESRPSRQSLWEYVFFIDIVGHQSQPQVQRALSQLEQRSSFFKNLGSYPKALI